MSKTTAELVRESWAGLAGDEVRLAEIFYAKLFAQAPDKARLFGTADMNLQRLKFAEMITDIVRFAHRPEALREDLELLADRHVGYGVEAEDYLAVGDILLAALGEVLGPRFTPEVRQAWAEAYTTAAETMLRQHRRKGGKG